MLGFVAAVAVEAATGKNVIQQAQAAPLPIAAISILFIVASIIPIVRGVPRKGNSIFTADAELWNGRLVSCPDYCNTAACSAQAVVCIFCTSTWCSLILQVPAQSPDLQSLLQMLDA